MEGGRSRAETHVQCCIGATHGLHPFKQAVRQRWPRQPAVPAHSNGHGRGPLLLADDPGRKRLSKEESLRRRERNLLAAAVAGQGRPPQVKLVLKSLESFDAGDGGRDAEAQGLLWEEEDGGEEGQEEGWGSPATTTEGGPVSSLGNRHRVGRPLYHGDGWER